MLLKEKLKKYPFSPSEKIVINYILEHNHELENLSMKEIAKQTYTTPSLLSRIAKKLGYQTWLSLKKDYLNENEYINNHFKDIDANLPFSQDDSLMTIASKITSLTLESVEDTLSLIQHDSLQKAIQIINNAQTVKLFGISNIVYCAQEFKHKMRHVNKNCIISPLEGEQGIEASLTSASDCAIIISYSGESTPLLKVIKNLVTNNVPIIAITSIGDNSVSLASDVVITMTTREKNFSKIAGFSSLASIHLILDIIYSGYFALNYQENYKNKIELAKSNDLRVIHNEIIEEM